MSSSLPAIQPSFAPDDYEAIEEAVMETSRGRWFLAEYARRMRAAETAKLLEAVTRIEHSLRGDAGDPQAALSNGEMGEAVAAIEKRLSEIAWSLRERGFDGRTCAEIEAQARALRQIALPGGASKPPALAAVPPLAREPAPICQPAAAPALASVTRLNATLPEVRPADADAQLGRFATLVEIEALSERERAVLFS